MLFRRLVKSGGLLVISDVVPPEVPAATDAMALLRFGKDNGFFFAAVWGLLQTLSSNYWRLRSRLGLTRYAEAPMIENSMSPASMPQPRRQISATTRRGGHITHGRADQRKSCAIFASKALACVGLAGDRHLRRHLHFATRPPSPTATSRRQVS